MPLRGQNHSPAVSNDNPFFRTLAELDDWATVSGTSFASPLSGVLPYVPRSKLVEKDEDINKGKLLVSYVGSGAKTDTNL
jgi:mannosyl-glycoprotein endo-beta-N-acetylglucosaminidase